MLVDSLPPPPSNQSSARTGLLVSVRSLEEAWRCHGCRLEVLDLKEPNAGALGMVPIEVVHEVGQWLLEDWGQAPAPKLSLAAGELRDWHDRTQEFELLEARMGPGLSFLKVGLAGMARQDWQSTLDQLWRRLPSHVSPVAVAYADAAAADAPPPQDVVAFAARHPRVETLLVDTATKGQDLFEVLGQETLALLVRQVKAGKLRVVLAGSITSPILPQAMALMPDLIGVRGAVCSGHRTSELDRAKLQSFRQQMDAWRPPSALPRETRLQSGRC